MRFCLLAAAAAALHAGVVRGVVLEHASGLPLARTVVLLTPLPGSTGTALSGRTALSGAFVFQNIPDGVYLLAAKREGFFTVGYGQRRPDGQGLPIEITKDSDLFADLRMFHQGAVTGRVLDENGVGMENIPVIAYRARLPLRSEGRAISDDRGVYRIHGLAPGKYWVRSDAHTLDDGSGRLPTFGREAPETKDAFTHPVRPDEDTPFADVRPVPGRLFRVSGLLQCAGGAMNVRLSSETGARSTRAACGKTYMFEGVAPGSYQVLAADETDAGYIEVSLDRNTSAAAVQATEQPRVDFYVTRPDSQMNWNIPITILGRRDDLSGTGKMEEIKRGKMLPGHWDMAASVSPDQYVESIATEFTPRRTPTAQHPPDAFDVFLEPRFSARVRIVVSDQAGHLDGSVMRDTKPVPGAMVFLWPLADAARRSLGGWRQMLADISGHFRFDGLPPGEYRILASFDLSEIDEESVEEARALSVTVEASQTKAVEVPLWIAP